MIEKSTGEDQLDAIERILTQPMPIVGNWERVYSDRINLALAVVRGHLHPGDVRIEAPATVEDQVASAFGALDAALKD